MPQDPGHGSLHLLPTHAKCDGQSWLMTHSGRQLGGAPNIPGRQEQTARSSTERHSAFGPQGDGMQGVIGGFSFGSAEITQRFLT